jgi:hypothetical protein
MLGLRAPVRAALLSFAGLLMASAALAQSSGNDTAALSTSQRGQIANHVRGCWHADPGMPDLDKMTVLLTVTTDAAGVARQAVVAPEDQRRVAGNARLRVFAQRAVRAALDPQCALYVPLPQSMLGKTNVVTFRFSPYGQSGSPQPGTNAATSLPTQTALAAPAPMDAQQSATFRQGQMDRQSWEAWFDSQTGDYRAGAEYWAAHRSLPNPGSCSMTPSSAFSDWTAGCLAAQQKLAASDVRRKTEPGYRLGWNNPAPVASSPAPANSGETFGATSRPPSPSTEPAAEAPIRALPPDQNPEVAPLSPAPAQSEPSARRVYLLCQMEDPSCGPLLEKAYNDFLANPTFTTCSGSGHDPTCPAGTSRHTATCIFRSEPRLTLEDIYRGYMMAFEQTNRDISMFLNVSPRIMMFVTMSGWLHRCSF